MENYTKYKLKSSDELASVLNGKDNLFVIACNKCFKEFETVEEPDCDEFLKFAKEQGKTVTGNAKVDFLCNKMHTERKLQDLLPEGTENVVVIPVALVFRLLRIWLANRSLPQAIPLTTEAIMVWHLQRRAVMLVHNAI